MNYSTLAFFCFLLFSFQLKAEEMTVYKSPYCGCCDAWAEQVDAAAFKLNIVEQTNNDGERKKAGIPAELASCHTAFVGGYAIEGHVPINDIKRLLSERPQIMGISVPGMPASSPGMDVPGNTDPYQVIAVDEKGGLSVYSEYNVD